MKQFNLTEYLKNPSKKVITRDGRSVKMLCTDKIDEEYPIVALICGIDEDGNPYEDVALYTINGNYCDGDTCNKDIFFAPEKKEGWISIYMTVSGKLVVGSYIDETEELSKDRSIPYPFSKRIATIKIEWENNYTDDNFDLLSDITHWIPTPNLPKE